MKNFSTSTISQKCSSIRSRLIRNISSKTTFEICCYTSISCISCYTSISCISCYTSIGGISCNSSIGGISCNSCCCGISCISCYTRTSCISCYTSTNGIIRTCNITRKRTNKLSCAYNSRSINISYRY